MSTDNAPTATLSITELQALALEMEPFTATDRLPTRATAQRIETICKRYGLIFTSAPTQEPPCH